tara:strand:- start:1589 stop:2341 length:753 start_codon:yes stop_codon:yes gene_type:complete
MKIILDEREKSLHACLLEIIENNEKKFEIEKRPIELGDAHFVNDSKEIFIIERKSLTDLISSIKDGRYEEQSYRLIHSSGLYRHHIVYIIEGFMSQLRTPIEKKMVYSAMTMLQFYKGFSLVRTMSVQDTAEWIYYSACKIDKELARESVPWTPESKTNDEPPKNYCNFVKKAKKENITPENIGEIILSQIPGISNVSAMAIMQKYGTITNLIDHMRNNSQCLSEISCESKGKSRKLGKNVIENVQKYLL